MRIRIRFFLVPLCCFTLAGFGQQTKQKIKSADELPAHSYHIPVKASDLLADDATFKTLSVALQPDLEADLRQFDIQDKGTLKSICESLMYIAIWEGQYDKATSYLQRLKELGEKPSEKAMSGLMELPIIEAKRTGQAQAQATFEAHFKQRLNALDYQLVKTDLQQINTGFRAFTPSMLSRFIAMKYDASSEKTGTITVDAAMEVVQTRFTIREVFPHQEFILREVQAVIDAHTVASHSARPDPAEAVAPAAVQEPALAEEPSSKLQTMFTGHEKCLGVVSDGVKPIMAQCGDVSGQAWRVHSAEELGYVHLMTDFAGSHECMEVSERDNNEPQMAPCAPHSGQFWTMTPSGNSGHFRLTNKFTGPGRCLDIVNDADSDKLRMAPCGNYSGQLWHK